MPNNTGLLLLGLGALLFLGRGRAVGKPDLDNRIVSGTGGGMPMGAAFDLQSYIDGLFTDFATVPVQPPMTFFYPSPVVVTSSGVPAVVDTAPEIVTDTTKVQIGGDGGRTVVESSLAIIRSEQIAKQDFAHAANADRRTAPEGTHFFYADTLEVNQIEAARQAKFAADLIFKNRAAQAALRNKTRLEQENLARGLNADGSSPSLPAGMSYIGESVPPTINYSRETAEDDEGLSFGSRAGQDIVVSADTEFLDVDFTPEYTETFVISGGMDSPMVFAGEEEDYQPTTTHQVTASYDIGF